MKADRKKRLKDAETRKRAEENAAESKKAEEAVIKARRTRQAPMSNSHGEFSEEERKRAQVSRVRKARETSREQEAQRCYQEPGVGFFGIQKDLIQYPPYPLTSTKAAAAKGVAPPPTSHEIVFLGGSWCAMFSTIA